MLGRVGLHNSTQQLEEHVQLSGPGACSAVHGHVHVRNNPASRRASAALHKLHIGVHGSVTSSTALQLYWWRTGGGWGRWGGGRGLYCHCSPSAPC